MSKTYRSGFHASIYILTQDLSSYRYMIVTIYNHCSVL